MNFEGEFIQVCFQFSADFIQPYFFQFALWCCNKLIGSYNMIEHCYPCFSVDLHRGFTCLYDLHYLMHMPVRFMSTSWRLNWWGPSLSAVLFPVVADPGTVEQWRVPFPASQASCRVSFPPCCSHAEVARILLTLISPTEGVLVIILLIYNWRNLYYLAEAMRNIVK